MTPSIKTLRSSEGYNKTLSSPDSNLKIIAQKDTRGLYVGSVCETSGEREEVNVLATWIMSGKVRASQLFTEEGVEAFMHVVYRTSK
jgi:hypothetical protein